MTIILDGTTGITTPAINSSGDLELPGGTANGVLYLNGSKVATSGSALVFDGTNLGVGTASPGAPLEVLSDSANLGVAASALLKGGSGPNLSFELTGTAANTWNIGMKNNDSKFYFTDGTDDRMTLDASGNLVVGGTTANGKLDVYGILTVSNSAGNYWAFDRDDTNGGLKISDGTTERARITSGGNFGIGTSSPTTTLTVNGLLTGGLGAQTTAGVTDWNDITNAVAGMGYTLLLGTATNGPGSGVYFHALNFEYNAKDGSGNMTQIAIPYNGTTFYSRYRFSGVWSSWTTGL